MGYRLLDQYSLLHFATGVVAYFIGLTFWQWFFIHLIFELTENTPAGISFINKYLTFWPGGKPEPDGLVNSTGDQLCAIIGWYVAYLVDHLGKKYNWYSSNN